ncbi:helix-turn-helix domain-containing protein [Massilia sp. DD77]|uniref:helix-turn-helix domain-containing protein n=1 Tax=Massilia sp. DD77 TaxID=3109349 RepID=UPI002FFFF995
MNHMSVQPELGAPMRAPLVPKCRRCVARDLYLPSGVDAREFATFNNLIVHRRRLARDDILVRRAQPFVMLYAVRFGHLKGSRPDHHGHPRVTAFYMTADLIGLDAISTGRHTCTLVALEDSEVCEIPYTKFLETLQVSPRLLQRFHCAMSQEIVREQAALLHANRSAAERLAGFLLSLSARYAQRGLSARRFRLHMSRADIGDHLGLALESVSRLLTRFRDEGWIALDKREIELLEPGRLAALLTAAPG